MKDDFSGKYHKFASLLTDTRWKMEGKTVLYVPNEGKELPEETAAKDNDYVKRMDGMICFMLIGMHCCPFNCLPVHNYCF